MNIALSIKIYPTNHALKRLKERYDKDSFKDIIPDENLELIPSWKDERKFFIEYQNHLIVLIQDAIDEFAIKTFINNKKTNQKRAFFVKFAEVIEE